jgi:hypothetical protein
MRCFAMMICFEIDLMEGLGYDGGFMLVYEVHEGAGFKSCTAFVSSDIL